MATKMTLSIVWMFMLTWHCPVISYRKIQHGMKDPEIRRDHAEQDYYRDARSTECRRCCDPGEYASQDYPQYRIVPQINITLLKGEKGEVGERGAYGKPGRTGQMGPPGSSGTKGSKGRMGVPGEPCKSSFAAFSVARKKGKFYCYVPGIYYFSLNVHTWNQKETYLHVMHNEKEVVVLYAQPSDRSIMQSQSLMLELESGDQVWVRLYKGERENAIFSDEIDIYIIFNGHLIKHKDEL
ncbi:complement C1q tumor necrosis factor-related protein 1 isoform X5 [Phyllopteryx taeniolatus]|uniref:complement C1q tumor necrosis factor-related protein 1 isoform X5 n=1 Tax=Phyllopteryx taeniolatus TaxID=161469 RepID=UPI002AD1E447|nr:complement C1q tumor necrosis factor-related protein 1 isoform X5 [Phyllopteryx taeniolatus]